MLKSANALICTFDITDSGPEVSHTFINTLEKSGIKCKRLNVSSEDADSIKKLSHGFDAVICLIHTTVGAWKKESALPASFKAVLRTLESLDKEKVIVSFGSPYVVSDLMAFDTVLCVFDSMSVCQMAATDVLLGMRQASGTLPVKM